jgi:hypothetical protein
MPAVQTILEVEIGGFPSEACPRKNHEILSKNKLK